jgi:ABC-type multidrug transport system fused ATPase/permease subunit
MKFRLPFLSTFFYYIRVFYSYAGVKLYVLIFVILFGAVSESFGLAMVLPLLDYQSSEPPQNDFVKWIYQALEHVGIKVSLVSLLVVISGAFILKGCLHLFQNFLSISIITGLNRDMRIDMCSNYKSMNYKYYANSNIGYLTNIVTGEISRAVAGMANFTGICSSIILTTVYLSATFLINWKMTLLAVIVGFFFIPMMKSLSQATKKLSIFTSGVNARLHDLIYQMINNFKYLKATDSFRYLYEELKKNINRHRDYDFRSKMLGAISTSFIEPLSVLVLCGIVLYSTGYRDQKISEIVILLIFFHRTFGRILNLQPQWITFNTLIGGIQVVETASQELSVNLEKTGSHNFERFREKIELKNVDFNYDTKQVLTDINLVIPKSKSIGIVGESGAGKTTLFDILVGLISPQSGRITIDDIDYSEIDLRSLRNRIGYVTQEPITFNDTIANNISFWQCESSDKICMRRIQKAAEQANCVEFINRTEDKYESLMGDRGVKFSGGQRQRIAIARELFKDPEIMMFDEATSSLDSTSENYMQESIKSMHGTKTLLIIAHRLSTVKNCDYIYVLEWGGIVEKGTFEELYGSKNSRFFRMCQMQNL